jgi:hypothetical protein
MSMRPSSRRILLPPAQISPTMKTMVPIRRMFPPPARLKSHNNGNICARTKAPPTSTSISVNRPLIASTHAQSTALKSPPATSLTVTASGNTLHVPLELRLRIYEQVDIFPDPIFLRWSDTRFLRVDMKASVHETTDFDFYVQLEDLRKSIRNPILGQQFYDEASHIPYNRNRFVLR